MDSICEQQLQKQFQKMQFWLDNYMENNISLIFFKKKNIEYEVGNFRKTIIFSWVIKCLLEFK